MVALDRLIKTRQQYEYQESVLRDYSLRLSTRWKKDGALTAVSDITGAERFATAAKKSLIQVLTAIAAIDVRIQNHATGLTVLDVRRRRLVEAKLASERREMAVREQKEMEGIYRAPPNQGA